MNTDSTSAEWTDIKGKIKAKWNKLGDKDFEGLKGNMDLISERLQTAYGYTKDKAEQEYKDFKKTLEPAAPVVEKAKLN
jgi:uncharacterized protein YjbJ (UPF0337 family)